jgi:hypothetical protein
MNATNYGKLIQLASGITGVSTAGNGVYQVPTNRRYHTILLQCLAICLAGGTALASTALTGTGTGATFTYAANSAGTIAATGAITVASGGSGYAVGNTLTIADPNYLAANGYVNPIVVTVATVSAGAISTITYAVNPQPTPPVLVISSLQLKVNGVIMRDVSVAQTLAIAAANPASKNYSVGAGELPLYFTEPWRKIIRRNTVTSWDTFGQPNFEIDINVSSGCTSPSVIGITEFDYFRNQATPKGGTAPVPFLKPIKYKSYSTGVIAAGTFDFTNLAINYPIQRIWIQGATPGQISRVTVIQDGNTVLDGPTAQVLERYGQDGFNITAAGFDTAYISDPDQRIGKALKVQKELIIRLYTSVSQNVTLLVESDPGNYA